MTINPAYPVGSRVFLRAANGTEHSTPGMVTSVVVYALDDLSYNVRWADRETGQYAEFELSDSSYSDEEEA